MPHRFSLTPLFFLFALLAFCVALALQPALAQHGGAGHAGGFGGNHAPATHANPPPPAPVHAAAPPPHASPPRPAPVHIVASPPPTFHPATTWINRPSAQSPHALLGGSFGSRPPLGNSPRPPHKIPVRTFPPTVSAPFFPGFFFPGIGLFGGFGLGFGPFGCDPFWNFGCNAFGYYDYYLPYYGFPSPPAPSEPSPYEEQLVPTSEYTVPYTYEPPSGPQATANQQNDETVLFFKDGRVDIIIRYWLIDNQLHYDTGNGVENVVSLDDVDLQATVNANASRGITFTLKPYPVPPPNPSPQPSAPTNPSAPIPPPTIPNTNPP